MRVTARGWMILVGFPLLFLALMVWADRRPDPPERVGQHSLLRVDDGGLVPVAASREAYDALVDAGVAHDAVGEAALFAVGLISTVPTGTPVLVIDQGMYCRRVRIESGALMGQAVWVGSHHIARR